MKARHLAALFAIASAISVNVARGQSEAPQQTSASSSLLRAAAQLDAAAKAQAHRGEGISLQAIVVPGDPDARVGSPSSAAWLRSELRRIAAETPPQRRAADLKDLASALRRTASNVQESTPHVPPQTLATAILAQKAYHVSGGGPAPEPGQSIFERMLQWLGERISALIKAVFGATVGVPVVSRALAAVLTLSLLALAAYLIFILVSLTIRRRQRTTTNAGTPIPTTVSPEELYELACAKARAGDNAQAAALLFQASLHSLDRGGKLPYDASRTPGEYRRAVRRSILAAADPFDEIAKTFVLAAFAQASISNEEFAAADRAYSSLQPLLST